MPVTHLVPNAVSLLATGSLAIWDIRYQKIPRRATLLYLLFGALWGVLRGDLFQLVLSAMPGALLLAAAYLSGERIGYGDGLVMLSSGMLIGCQEAVCAIIAGILLSGVYSLGLVFYFCLTKKTSLTKDSSFPFLPFLFLGQLLGMFYGE